MKQFCQIAGIIIALVLYAAAFLKLGSAVDPEWYVRSTTFSYMINIAAILIDLSLACALLSGVWQKQIYTVCAAIFASFVYLNLYFVFASQDCGCFGKYTPQPFTMMLLDAAFAIIAFLLARRTQFINDSTSYRRAVAAGVGFLGCLVFVVVYLNSFSPTKNLFDHATLISGKPLENVQLLRPNEWIGSEFVLLDFMNPPPAAPEGVFVFVSDNCEKCDSLLKAIEERHRNGQLDQNLTVVNIDGCSLCGSS